MLERVKLRVAAILVVVAGVGAACADLPLIASNTCGNRIIDTTEDCDVFAPTGSVCRAPGTVGACHYDCSGSNICPPSFTCGAVDKICRQATGTFAYSQTLFAQTDSLAFADFDGDGRDDALTSGSSDIRIHYFDGKLALSKTLILPIFGPRSHIGPLGADTNADFTVFRSSGLIDVFRGISDRTLAPVVYGSFPIPNTQSTARAFIARHQLLNVTGDSLQRPTGDDIFVFGSTDKGAGVVVDVAGHGANATAPTSDTAIALPDSTADKIAGAIAVGGFIEGSVCDQFAIGFSGDTKISLYSPCRFSPAAVSTSSPDPYVANTVLDALSGNPDPNYVPPARIALPAGVTVGASFGTYAAGPFAVDANADGHQDLVIAVTLAGAPQVYVAYGTGAGSFSSSPSLTPVDNAAAEFALINPTLLGTAKKNPIPLAIADLNGDNVLDFVFPDQMFFSERNADAGPGTSFHYVGGPSSPGLSTPWLSAVIGDLSHDGIPDVAVANPLGSIDFYLGTNTSSMTLMSYGLEGLPTNLVVGDFDGDLTSDLGIAVSGVPTADGGAPSDEIQVLFGQGSTFPATPTVIGSLDSVLQLTSGPLAVAYTGAPTNTNGLVGSMVALSLDASSNVYTAVLVGNPDRIITSSFALVSSSALQRASAIRGTIAPLATVGESDLLILAQNDQDSTYALWLAPSTGEAALDPTKLLTGPALPAGMNWATANIIATTLDASGLETAFALVSSTTTGQAQMFSIDPKTLMIGASIPIACTDMVNLIQVRDAVHGTDYDGDGNHDLLVYCPDVSGKTVMTMFWGNGTNTLDASRSTILPLPTDPVVGFTSYRTGPVIPRAVAMLTANGMFTTAPGGRDGRTFSAVTQDLTLPGGSDMSSADIDGDGVTDFAIVDATMTQIQFFRGIPINDSPSVP